MVVLYRWKSVGQERIDAHVGEIGAIHEKVPGLTNVKIGPRRFGQEQWTHAASLTFESAGAFEAYGKHPEHDRVATLIVPDLEEFYFCAFEC